MKEYDREIKKAYEHMGKLKSDVNCTPRPVTIAMYAFTILTIVCLLLMLFNSVGGWLYDVAPWVAMGGAACILIMYVICRSRGPLKYIEVMIKHEGVYLLFQVVSEKHVIFSAGGVTLEYKKGKINEIGGIMHPHLSYDAPLKAEFEKKSVTRLGTTYEGISSEFGAKPVKYKLTAEKKFVTGFRANGKRVLFDCINQKDALLTIPAAFAAEIKERGINLPKDVISK